MKRWRCYQAEYGDSSSATRDGNKYAFNGVYREIVPPEREVHTFEFEGKTKLTVTDLFQSVEDRDGMFNSGMKEGSTESMDRLEKLLKKLQ